MNTKKDIPQKDILPNGIPEFAKEKLAKETSKGNTKFALGGNIKKQITNNIELDEEFKKTYGAYDATIKSQHTVIIANAWKILENMQQLEVDSKTPYDLESGRE